jgi:hypothetical protein
MEETAAQKKKRLEKRNKYRNTVCSGCRHNYYNFPKGRSANGDVEVEEDYSCWSINSVSRGKCPCKS